MVTHFIFLNCKSLNHRDNYGYPGAISKLHWRMYIMRDHIYIFMSFIRVQVVPDLSSHVVSISVIKDIL